MGEGLKGWDLDQILLQEATCMGSLLLSSCHCCIITLYPSLFSQQMKSVMVFCIAKKWCQIDAQKAHLV